jgi:hypothetical protein
MPLLLLLLLLLTEMRDESLSFLNIRRSKIG